MLRDTFDDAIAYLTNPAPGHDEWQSAMKQFCSAIWGRRPGQSESQRPLPVEPGGRPAPRFSDVLQDAARDVATACDALSAEVTKIRSTITDVYKHAAEKTFVAKSIEAALELALKLPELALEFVSNIDNYASTMPSTCTTEKPQPCGHLFELKHALEEAERSVPRYSAEEARAEAFGVRALDEFKKEHPWTGGHQERRLQD